MINIKKEDIPAILVIALALLDNSTTILGNGFRASGPWQFNPDAVGY